MPELNLDAIGLPFDEAAAYFRGKARVRTTHWTDVWRTAHARGFMVAGATSDALLKDLQGAVQKAIERGTTLAEFRTDFDAIVAKHGWEHNGEAGWRARVIYETNLNTAYAAGRYAQMSDPDVLEAYPFWQYVHSGSRHPRLQHLAWNGLTLRANDDWWSAHYPPNGWHCGCWVRPVSEGGLGRMGKRGPDDAPDVKMREWRNPKDGKIHKVPVGIDPGFDWNPGKAWQDGMRHAPLRAEPVRPVLPPGGALEQDLQRWLRQPSGNVPAGHMTEAMREALGMPHDGVLFSEETFEKQKFRHPEITPEDYLQVPSVLARPDRLMWGGNGTVMAIGGGERRIAVVVKGLPHTDENFVVSVYPAWREKVMTWLLNRHRAQTAERGEIVPASATQDDAAASEDDDDE